MIIHATNAHHAWLGNLTQDVLNLPQAHVFLVLLVITVLDYITNQYYGLSPPVQQGLIYPLLLQQQQMGCVHPAQAQVITVLEGLQQRVTAQQGSIVPQPQSKQPVQQEHSVQQEV